MFVQFKRNFPEVGYSRGDIAECFVHEKIWSDWFLVVNKNPMSRDEPFNLQQMSKYKTKYIKGAPEDYVGGHYIFISGDDLAIVEKPATNRAVSHLLQSNFSF